MSDPAPLPVPLIVTALLGDADFAWADGLRRAHFPPERNVIAAHLTMFHHLPPSVEAELHHRLTAATRGQQAPAAKVIGTLNLGRGTALRVEAPGLTAIRADLAEAFAPLLTPQDRAGWRPHITIQNKVAPADAAALRAALDADFRPRPLAIAGLGLWRYRGGPWEAVSRHPFAGPKG